MGSLALGPFTSPQIEWSEIVALLILLGGVCTLLLGGSLVRRWSVTVSASVTTTTAVAAGVVAMFTWSDLGTSPASTILAEALTVDRVSAFATIIICVSLALASLLVSPHLIREGIPGPEVHALLVTSAIGGVVMSAANDLIVLFLGLEILSLSLYLLAASHRRRDQSQEAGLKYFVLGGFSSAFFLYGIALVYGATGTTNVSGIVRALEGRIAIDGKDTILLVGVAMLIVGLGFKVSAAPFQVWTPDVYEGSPTPITAFMASAGKVAAFGALIRVLVTGLDARVDDWRPVVWAMSILTVFVGSTMAVVQTNVKRMLAYSSISHAGFILIGVEVAAHRSPGGVSSSMAYLAVYSVLVMGSFAVVMAVSGRGDGSTSLADFRGLGSRNPLLALAFSTLLLAQAGVPLTSGFVAKFGVIKAAVDVRSYAIAVAAMVGAVIGAYLYLRILVSMWMENPSVTEPIQVPRAVGTVIALSVTFTLAVGIYPSPLLDAVRLIR